MRQFGGIEQAAKKEYTVSLYPSIVMDSRRQSRCHLVILNPVDVCVTGLVSYMLITAIGNNWTFKFLYGNSDCQIMSCQKNNVTHRSNVTWSLLKLRCPYEMRLLLSE